MAKIIGAACRPFGVGQNLVQTTTHIKPIFNVASSILNRFAALSMHGKVFVLNMYLH